MSQRLAAVESELASLRTIAASIPSLKRLLWITLAASLLGSAVKVLQSLHYLPEPPSATPNSAPSGNSNSVQIGAALPVSSAEDSRKNYLTTAEVAARENIAERTLLTWIAEGRIVPPPDKSNRAWIIPANYRVQPPDRLRRNEEARIPLNTEFPSAP